MKPFWRGLALAGEACVGLLVILARMRFTRVDARLSDTPARPCELCVRRAQICGRHHILVTEQVYVAHVAERRLGAMFLHGCGN
jgi:hypothetical protein